MIGAAVFAAALVFVATSHPGPGLDPDSMAYVGAATSLAEHGRLRVPTAEWSRPDSTSSLSLWPPGLPTAIALPVFLGESPVQSARWVNVVAAAMTSAAIVLIIAGPLGYPVGVIAALIVFATQAVFDAHISVLSEPLFIALILLVLAAMVYARDRLLLMGLLATLAVAVRYAGASAPLAVVLWTLFDARHDLRTRVRRAGVVAFIPCISIALWFARTAMVPDRHETPRISLYGGWGATLAQARDTLAEWLAPLLPDGAIQRTIAILVAISLVVFIVTAVRDTAADRFRRMQVGGVSTLLGATSLLGSCYLLVIVASRAFIGGTIPLDWRILSPVIALIEIASVVSIGYWWRAYLLPTRIAIAVLVLGWAAAAATVTVNDAMYATSEGSDFAGSDWRESPLIAWVRDNGAGHPLYSNWPAALYFHANRIARELPKAGKPGDVTPFGDQLGRDRGYVVAFNEASPDFVPPDTIARRTGLRLVVRAADGAVWAAGSAPLTDSAARRDSATAPTSPKRRG